MRPATTPRSNRIRKDRPMADYERYRYDEDGYIARRGFGNESAGYDRGYDDRYGRGRERDFGDSAGYGSGGSTRDWRDGMGGGRGRGGLSQGRGPHRPR